MIFKQVVKKVKKFLQSEPHSSRMHKENKKLIEFFGPSGVGKSTLYYSVQDRLNARYLHKDSLNDFQLNEKFCVNIDFNWSILKNKSYSLDKMNISDFSKIETLSYLHKILVHNLIMTQSNVNSNFLIDEGLCSNFYEELNGFNYDHLKMLLENRILIVVLPRDVKTVAKQIIKRTNETGQTVFFHRNLTEKQLMALTENSLIEMKIFLEKADKLNVPVLKLYSEDGVNFNVNRILQFESCFK